MTFKRAYPYKPKQLSKGLLSVFLLIASVMIADIKSAPDVLADPGVTTDASWMPFIGEYDIWCTLATGGTGSCGNHHSTWGIDFELPFNHPVYSAGAGTVKQVFEGCGPATGSGYCNGGAGNWISVDHGDHWARYIHLAYVNATLNVGDWVEIGDLIGYAGCAGCTYTGTHLHYYETLPQSLPVSRIYFGKIFACHGTTKVTYPDHLGTTNWQEVPYGAPLRNDGYACADSSAPFDPSQPDTNQIDQDTPGFMPAGWIGAESGDRFGSVTDTGDFDGDGRMDLLVGAPEESVGSIADAGLVHVIYGSGGWSNNDGFYQNTSGWPDASESGDRFGSALTTGDFNNDGYDDMVVGVPGEDLGSSSQLIDAGIITVAYGSASGLTSPVNMHQYSPGVGTNSESGDLFGASLASGDINGDGYDDVIVGVPGEGISKRDRAGAVHVIYGSASGLTGVDSDLLHQDARGVKSRAEVDDAFGEAVEAADINGDGYDDVIVGVPGEGVGWGARAQSNAGAVHVIYGSASGASGTGSQWFYQNSPGWPGRSETNDRFGSSIAVSDIDGDGIGDLVVGVPGEKLGSHTEAGQVQIRYNPGGWSQTPASVQTLYQNLAGVQNKVETGDRFGAHLEMADVTGDSNVDLIVGVPGESIATRPDAGAVAIFKSVGGQITTAEDQLFYANQSIFTGDSEANAEFGAWFSVLNGNLIIGSPGRTVSGLANAGAFYYLDL